MERVVKDLPVARVRPRTGGGLVIYNADGEYVAHTADVANFKHSEAGMRTTAARMAHNQELYLACRAVDLDYENLGFVTSRVVDMVRAVLSQVEAL